MIELILIGVLIALGGGIALAGRWCKTVPMQIFVGILLGLSGIVALGVLALGVLFTGCLVVVAGSGMR
jgi:hypothetical protein